MFEKGFFFASPSTAELFWVSMIIASFLVAAVLIELRRRRIDRKQRLAAEWKQVHEIAAERQLSKEESLLLDTLIHKHTPREPLRTVTVRQQFDECVAGEIPFTLEAGTPEEMDALEQKGYLLRDLRVRLGLDYVPYGQRINSTRELVRGQRLWTAPMGEGLHDWARLSVAAVDEAFFHLAPGGAAALPHAKPGDTRQCRMWREQDARYAFTIAIVRVDTNPPAWVIRHTDQLDRLQSRAHYRIHFESTTNFSILNAPIGGDMSDVHERQAVTKARGRITSLSGGGFAAVLAQAVPKQVLLRTLLEIPTSDKPIQIVGQPVDITPMAGGHYLVRATFVGMSEEARDRIARHIAHCQQHAGGPEQDEEERP